MLRSDEQRTYQLNMRINSAERKMIERLQSSIRPRVSVSRLLIYLAEERAEKEGIIQFTDEGYWTISV